MRQSRILIADPLFVLEPFFDKSIFDELNKKFEVVINTKKRVLTGEEIVRLGHDCKGIIAGLEKYDKKVLAGLKKVKVISRAGSGLDNIDLDEAKKRKIVISNVYGDVSFAVAELALGLILGLLRNISLLDHRVRKNKWKKIHGELLRRKTVGIVGVGNIGKKIIHLVKPFGVKVLGFDILPDKDWMKENEVELVSQEKLLKQADIIILSLSYSEKNKHMISYEEIDKMKLSARLVNLSRGGLINEKALIEGLREGKIAGAALDVFEEEPYIGELARFKQVILTPHIGASTKESRKFMQEQAINNLIEELGNE